MVACAVCGEENPARARFCLNCGTPLAATAGGREARKVVTVVFSDLAGSTSLGERLDPESLSRVMARWFAAMRAVLERHGGTVQKFIGDAVMAVFGIPALHEDDAVRAVRAAAELRQGLEGLNHDLAHDWGLTLALRTGINTGEVVTGDPKVGDALVLGDAVNVAARLEQAAAPGEVLLGETTWRLVRDAARVEPVAPLTLKGKRQPVAAFRLLSVTPGVPGHARRLDAPMVGRERPLRLLHDTFEAAAGDGACHLVTVLGAAGVGKSRLLAEFLAEVAGRATVLQGRCLSYGEGITWWPVTELLRAAAGLTDADDPDTARAKLMAVLAGEERAELVADRLAGLLGLAEPTGSPEELPWAVRRLLEALARDRPLVVLLDDLHWAEPTLLDLVEHVADWSRDAPILLCCLARPELLEARPGWGGGKLNAASLLLQPLGAADSERLVEHLLGRVTLAEAARRHIVETAEGNPLFVEELLGMLIDDGLLVRADGGWAPTADLAAVPVPTSIATLLTARMEQLDHQERAVVGRASVIGQTFYRDAVAELSADADRPGVGVCLRALVRKELVRPTASDVAGQDAFRFRHLLLRDAAYAGLPKALRAELHQRFAGWLERAAGERLREHPELLAYHLERAYRLRAELGPVDERGRALAHSAAERLTQAGRRALALGDMPAVAKLLQRAVGLLPADAPGRPELLVDLGAALLETGAVEQGDAALAEAAAAVDLAADPRRAWRVRLDCSLLAVVHGRERRGIDQVRQEAERAIAELTELGDDAGLARAWLLLGEVHNVKGRMAAMAQAAEHAIGHARRARELPKVDLALSRLGIALAFGPTPVEEAIGRARELLDQARGRRRWEAGTLRALARLEAKRGRFPEARALLDQGKAIVEELGLRFNLAAFALTSGEIEALAGELVAAEQQLRLASELFGRLGDKWSVSLVAPNLAEVLHLQGRNEEALRFTEEAEAAAEPELPEQFLWRKARARVLAVQGAGEEAERLAREAVDLAARTDHLEEHADALMTLADVLRHAGRAAEAALAVRDALRLYKQKGNTVLTRRAQEALGSAWAAKGYAGRGPEPV
jgi:class 3 adenylate cyclase/tetratricopeptide (TPR) repeat protein